MSVVVSTKGIENLVKQINDVYGKHIVTAELHSDGWFILVGENPIRNTENTCDAVHYLEGVKHGIELMKEGLQLLIGQRNSCP